MSEKKLSNAVVAGAGPAGLTAAAALARAGVDTVLFAGPTFGKRPSDARTTALMLGAVRLLERFGIWPELQARAAPLRRLRLVDRTDWSIRAPEVEFDAGEIDEEAFGWNIANDDLIARLTELCKDEDRLEIVLEHVSEIQQTQGAIRIDGGGATVREARLLTGADGRSSLCRKAAGIKVSEWSYPQTAIACTFAHEKPHRDTSVEFHTSEGPCTLVPMPGERSSLVWVTSPEHAERLSALPDATFATHLSEATVGHLGALSEVSERACFPIGGMTARSFAQRRTALVGEAAHVLPPIGAQGLNLGMRDAALIAELAGDAVSAGQDPGGGDVLAEYDRRRRLDIVPRTAAVDLLNRSLFSGMLPLHGLRGLGLFMLDTVGPLRRAVMREGMEPQHELPRLMQR